VDSLNRESAGKQNVVAHRARNLWRQVVGCNSLSAVQTGTKVMNFLASVEGSRNLTLAVAGVSEGDDFWDCRERGISQLASDQESRPTLCASGHLLVICQDLHRNIRLLLRTSSKHECNIPASEASFAASIKLEIEGSEILELLLCSMVRKNAWG
jgi:hypothetical protein